MTLAVHGASVLAMLWALREWLGDTVVARENSQKEAEMPKIADLLHEALRHGDEQGRTQILGKHLPEHLFADLAEQTYQYALEHAEDAGEGGLIFKEGIEGWWTQAGDLAKGEFSRLHKLRSDVMRRLTKQDLASRPNPRSTLLHVRRRPVGTEPAAVDQ